jgi:hypothetical protein
VNNIVAVAVEQAQINVTVITVITVDVMNLDHVRCRERKITLIAFAALPLQEFDHPHRFERVASWRNRCFSSRRDTGRC